MSYIVKLSDEALKDIQRLRKSGELPALKKLNILISELEEHPETGTGHPERLKENLIGKWSRRITQKHRLIYEIENEIVTVFVLNAYGHYGEK